MATLVHLTELSFHLDLDLRADVIRKQGRQGGGKESRKQRERQSWDYRKMLANIFYALSRATTARDTNGRVLSTRDRVAEKGHTQSCRYIVRVVI